MRLYPNTTDRTPFQTRFGVHSEAGGIVPTEIITETPDALEGRLEHDFPAYRAIQVGKRLVAELITGGESEV